MSARLKVIVGLTSVALMTAGCAATAETQNAIDAPKPGNLQGSQANVAVRNDFGEAVKVEFTVNKNAQAERVPQCLYTQGSGGGTNLEDVTVNPTQTRSAGVVEDYAPFFGTCGWYQGYLGVKVTKVSGGGSVANVLQTTGPSWGNLWEWVQNTDVPVPANSTSGLAKDAPMRLYTETSGGVTTIVVAKPEPDAPEVVTDAKQAAQILRQYCGTKELLAANCELKNVVTGPAYLPPQSYGEAFNNCSAKTEADDVEHTVAKSQTYSSSQTISLGASGTTTVSVPLVSSVEVTMSTEYANTWGEEVSVSVSDALKVPHGTAKGFVEILGAIVSNGDFLVTMKDKGNRQVLINGFSYNFPLKSDYKDPGTGKTWLKAQLGTHTYDCKDLPPTGKLPATGGTFDLVNPAAAKAAAR